MWTISGQYRTRGLENMKVLKNSNSVTTTFLRVIAKATAAIPMFLRNNGLRDSLTRVVTRGSELRRLTRPVIASLAILLGLQVTDCAIVQALDFNGPISQECELLKVA